MPEFDTFMRDAFGTLLTTHGESGEGGERLVYRFRSGGSRTVNGIVNRNPPQRVDEMGNLVCPQLTISLHHDAVLGVLHTEVDAGDRIDVAVKKGGAVERRLVKRVSEPGGGTITLEVS